MSRGRRSRPQASSNRLCAEGHTGVEIQVSGFRSSAFRSSLGEGELEVAELRASKAGHAAHEHSLRLGGEIFPAKVCVHSRDDIAEEPAMPIDHRRPATIAAVGLSSLRPFLGLTSAVFARAVLALL